MKVGSLCSGYGGLDLTVCEVFGAAPAWFAEIDPAACAVLAHRFPGVPNLGDLTTVDWLAAPWVEIVTAGWPCQPWSLAGKRKGIDDERAIWPAVADAILRLRPRLVVLENVPAIVTAGELARAIGDLAALGYDTQWISLRASDVGAPHRRERIFILAAADTTGDGRREGRAEPAGQLGRPDAAVGGGVAADTDCGGFSRDQEPHGKSDEADNGAPRNHTERRLLEWGAYTPAVRAWELHIGRPAPAPTVVGRRGGRQLNPAFVEWMMGLPAGWVTDVDGLSRNDMLRLLGNGVVPKQAAAALRQLLTVTEMRAS